MDFNGKFRLLIYGPDIINKVSEPVERSDFDELLRLKEYMVGVMRKCHGTGLAAPQVGIFKQILICETSQGIISLVNPEVTRMFGKELAEPEWCLSIPPVGNDCSVPRMESLMVCASTLESPEVKRHFKFTSKEARVVQRELDYLTGTFFVDRVGEKKKRLVIEKFQYWKHNWETAGRPFPY